MSPSENDLSAVAAGIERLVRWVRRQAQSPVSTSTITTLDTLMSNGPMRISQLAEREAISQPGMTTLINRLEAAGQAERIDDPTDGRAALVRITELGSAMLARRQADREQALRAGLSQLDPVDQAALIAALPAVARLISSQREEVDR